MPRSSSVNRQQQMADRPPSRGGGLDGRLPIAKRRKELIAGFVAAMGQDALSPVQSSAVVRAADLVALSEQQRAKALSGDAAVDMEGLVRLEGAADRAVRRLGIKPGTNQSKPPSIAEYAARKAAEKAASKPAGDPA
jgi:hypothetical protein